MTVPKRMKRAEKSSDRRGIISRLKRREGNGLQTAQSGRWDTAANDFRSPLSDSKNPQTTPNQKACITTNTV